MSSRLLPSDEGSLAIREALSLLGVRRLLLAIHDQSFPSTADEDVGRGSPYGRGARELLDFARAMGFDGIQLGPQGDTTLANPSPYDGAHFTKSPMSIALGTLSEDDAWSPLTAGLLEPQVGERRKATDGTRDGGDHWVTYEAAWRGARRTLADLYARFARDRSAHPILEARFAKFLDLRGDTLDADGVFEALATLHGTDDWTLWPDQAPSALDRVLFLPPAGAIDAAGERLAWIRAAHATDLERHAFGQFVLHEQHHGLRLRLAQTHNLVLFGDLPIGFSHRDVWSRRGLFLHGYLMGAPPSRTNPAGQPWGFPVLDPAQVAGGADGKTPGPVLQLLHARIDMLLADFDGVRIDHPHGLVCPWVYSAADPDPAAAVLRGARLFSSPNLPDHPALARFAVPTAEQLSTAPGTTRYADDWVVRLRDDQVASYGVLFDAIIARVTATGRNVDDVVCEVLSTWPYPLRRVMERHDLGRFCVLQKANLNRADDVYRAENASPRDWIMLGNHDTPPIWLLVEGWHGAAVGEQWAAYLAERLITAVTLRARFARWVAADARHLAQAMCATLFAGPARQVSVFFADLFGMREIYNRPGVVDPRNWILRLPGDWHQRYRDRVGDLAALNIPLALALALVAQPRLTATPSGRAVVDRLVKTAASLTPALDGEIKSLITAALSDPRSPSAE